MTPAECNISKTLVFRTGRSAPHAALVV